MNISDEEREAAILLLDVAACESALQNSWGIPLRDLPTLARDLDLPQRIADIADAALPTDSPNWADMDWQEWCAEAACRLREHSER